MKALDESLPVITIVIPCRNEQKSIVKSLDSLTSQEMPQDWEAIIADGISDDGTRAILEKYCHGNSHLQVIDNPSRIVSAGLNDAIGKARGDIILRMDAHTEYAPDYVLRCVQALETSGAENVGGPARTKTDGLVQRAIGAAFHSPFSTGGAKFHSETYEGFVDTVPYGCWRKSTLDRIGPFDEALVRNQDDELNLRITRAGGKIWQSPDIVSWYRPRKSLIALFRQYYQYGFWKVEVIRKHRIAASWRHLVPAVSALSALIVVAGAAVSALAGQKEIARLLSKVFLIGAASYAIISLAASVHACRRYGRAVLPLLPLVFAIYHASYSAGFLANVLFRPLAGLARVRRGTLTSTTLGSS